MTTRAEEYRRKAEEAEREAERANDTFLRQKYMDIAREWREMADHIERYRR